MALKDAQASSRGYLGDQFFLGRSQSLHGTEIDSFKKLIWLRERSKILYTTFIEGYFHVENKSFTDIYNREVL